MPHLSDTEDGAPGIVVRPSGDIDLGTVERFRKMVHEALGQHPAALVIDLRDVTFLDSSGLSVLAAALRSQRERNAVVALVNPQPIVRRAIELVGLDLLFDVAAVPSRLLESSSS